MTITIPTYRPTVTAAPSAATYSLLPVTYTLNYAFSAKERDVETGLSVTSLRSVSSSSLNQTRTSSALYSLVRRFGARYYSSDLSIWLSVDPMSDKYPSLSPYVYCADNPVRVVDPEGMEIGEFHDWNGKLLGDDGNDDWNVYFVSDEESIKKLERNNGKQTNLSDVTVDWSTNKFQLGEIVNVYDRTVLNGGSREEASTFSEKGRPLLFKRYPTGFEDGTIDIDSKGYISIHSHRLDMFECPDGSGATCFQSPFTPSEDYDKILFKNYSYNIIVGNRSLIDPTAYAVLYNSETKKVGNIEINTLRNIVLPK